MIDCKGLGDCADDRMQRIYEYLDGAFTLRTSKRSKPTWTAARSVWSSTTSNVSSA